MSTIPSVERDERTLAVENSSYRWGYLMLAYALLIDVMYRSFVRHEAAWDLVALVVGGGAVCAAYQARQKILSHSWAMRALLVACIAAVIAAIIAIVK